MPLELSRFARVGLGTWPTPLEPCPRLSAALGPRILVKRDDVNGLGAGGNKLRKLEFLLGAAVEDGVHTVVTFGGLQTNHGRQTAAACARLGLRSELVLTKVVPRDGEAYERSGNVALDKLYGARVHVCDDEESTAATLTRILDEASAAGHRVATLPMGGSSGLGALGYVVAAAELHAQLGGVLPDRVVCAIGSAGTVSGLALGAALLDWPVLIDAAAVSPSVETKLADVRRLVDEAADLLGVGHPNLDQVRVTDRALGPGYGVPTEEVWEAIRLFGRTEGIALDPVYTGKAAAALVDAVRTGDIGPGETVVFVHTGGLPGLFGYERELIDAVSR